MEIYHPALPFLPWRILRSFLLCVFHSRGAISHHLSTKSTTTIIEPSENQMGYFRLFPCFLSSFFFFFFNVEEENPYSRYPPCFQRCSAPKTIRMSTHTLSLSLSRF
ncbi:hypothetical protein ACOSQ2_025089 [Xanthoceras sorbifolium]